ncbi:uncharacterized protein LOC110732212 [Chenopodium quinoa]|uniref:uncharacterized protein LOC110732212 n=1 Tax=Chenopodium quinoa TaxID=63459 RepID=UPI000B76FBE4|nr:uncharacterized protein LOC110732212 [Chenopodium quinoa]
MPATTAAPPQLCRRSAFEVGQSINPEFVKGVDEFIQYVKDNPESSNPNEVRCPCAKCKNKRLWDPETVKIHLFRTGFIPNYYEWMCHGEGFPIVPEWGSNEYHEMVFDAFGHSQDQGYSEQASVSSEEKPNAQAKHFLELLKASERPLYEGSSLSVEAIPNNNHMADTFYEVKKIVKGLELPHERIHAFPKGCMLFWKDDAQLSTCRACGSDRYKETSKGSLVPLNVLFYIPITPRLQRHFTTKNISEEMTWHSKNPRVQGTMAHPSDSEAWKHLDSFFSEFASEPRNVRLGLCTDGFAPHGKFGGQYSCWSVTLTPYNLPPSMCMKQFMFLSLLVCGPKNPKGNLDVYMQLLIEELKQLWEVGAHTYDISMKRNFNLRAAILWTVSDFPAYGMLSGWAISGKKACQCCMDKRKAFWLEHGCKVS